MSRMLRIAFVVAGLPLVAAILLMVGGGCRTTAEQLSKAGTAIGVATGNITKEEAASIRRGASAVGKAFEKLTPEQEYYIGRAVAATLLETYPPYDDEAATLYLNTLGQALALASDKPVTFGGWHFLIMDTDEINAFAAPGGFILVSRGMLRCCRNEDELAAVLAHEIAHVQHEHGLRAIRQSRWTSAFTLLGAEAARQLGSEELAELTTAFEGAIGDVTRTLATSGYARRLEREADATAIGILQRIGYHPGGLVSMLGVMGLRLEQDARGFAKTHPDPNDRIRDLVRQIGRDTTVPPPPPRRQARFNKAMSGI